MEIKVFNSELTYLGVVDDFESFTFVSKYNACGSFKIKGMYTPDQKESPAVLLLFFLPVLFHMH